MAREVSKLKSENRFLVKGEDGRKEFEKFDSRGWPMARPALAAATAVPVPTSYGSAKVMVSDYAQIKTPKHGVVLS